MTEGNTDPGATARRFNRRSLIATSAGVAGTVAVTTIVPGAATIATADAASTAIPAPTTPVPNHPVVAYVHDAGRGEVTVVSGASERTYRDRALVKRLLAAASQASIKEAN